MQNTIFENKSSCEVKSSGMKIVGKNNGHDFVLESIVSFEDPSSEVNSLVKVQFDLVDVFNRACEYNVGENFKKKLVAKFKKYEDMQISDGVLVFIFKNEEFITSNKKAIKWEVKIDKMVKVLDACVVFIEALIEKKIERKKQLAAKKAERVKIEKEAAESIPGATVAEQM